MRTTPGGEVATALADAEKRAALFQSIMDSMGESVLVVDRNGNQVFANKELLRFQGEVKPGQHHDDWRSPRVMKIYDADGHELPPDQWPIARALRGDVAVRRRQRKAQARPKQRLVSAAYACCWSMTMRWCAMRSRFS